MRPPVAGPAARLTVGVEEEFLLIDPGTGRVVPAAEEVLARLEAPYVAQVVPELTRFQMETNTTVHTGLPRLERELLDLRAAVARAAEGAGVRLAACGIPLLGNAGVPPLSHVSRYRRMHRQYREILRGQGVCGCHVHVGIADRAEAVQVINHVRPWLPVLQALAANSPIAEGVDTGYASWRTLVWSRWPSAEPPPFFRSPAHYDALVDGLYAAGAIMDRGMVYWQVRVSHHLPTLEFRVADSCATATETVLLAGIIRALAATALAEVRRGVPPVPVDQTLLNAACWRAARDGLEGDGLDLLSGRRVPAWRLAGRLLERLRPALAASGDLPVVERGLAWLRGHGSGAARQRSAFRRRGHLPDVAELLVRQTWPTAAFAGAVPVQRDDPPSLAPA